MAHTYISASKFWQKLFFCIMCISFSYTMDWSQEKQKTKLLSLYDLCAQKVATLSDWELPEQVLPRVAYFQMQHFIKPSVTMVPIPDACIKINNPVFGKGVIFYCSPACGFQSPAHVYCYNSKKETCLCIQSCKNISPGQITCLGVNPKSKNEIVFGLNGGIIFYDCKQNEKQIINVSKQHISQLCCINETVWAADRTGIIYKIIKKELVETIKTNTTSYPVGLFAYLDKKMLICYINGAIKTIDGNNIVDLEQFSGCLNAADLDPNKEKILLAVDGALQEYDIKTKQCRIIGHSKKTIHFSQCLYLDSRKAVTVDIMGGILLWDLLYATSYPIEEKRFAGKSPNASRVACKDGLLAYDQKLVSIAALLECIDVPLPERASFLEKQKKEPSPSE